MCAKQSEEILHNISLEKLGATSKLKDGCIISLENVYKTTTLILRYRTVIKCHNLIKMGQKKSLHKSYHLLILKKCLSTKKCMDSQFHIKSHLFCGPSSFHEVYKFAFSSTFCIKFNL